MKFQFRFSIRARLIVGFMIILIILSVISGFSIVSFDSFEKISQDIDNRYAPGLATIGTMHGDVQDTERMTLRYMLETDTRERERLQGELNDLIASIGEQRKEYEGLIPNDKAAEAFKTFTENFDTFTKGIPPILNAISSGQGQAAAINLLMQVHPSFIKAAQSLDSIIELTDEATSEITAKAYKNAHSIKLLSIGLTAGALLIGILLSIFIANRISKPIVQLARRANRISEGDLTLEPIITKRKDEVGALIADFNTMVHSLREVMTQVYSNAHHVAATSEQLMASAEQTSRSSEEIASAIQEIASGTDQQARSAAESSRASGEMSKGVEQISSSIQVVAVGANETSVKAAVGSRMIEDVTRQMQVIQEKVAAAAHTVHMLGERSEQIDSIVKIITTIAQQTNLLALNAGIEAARAGDHGKGFAVVATEVRKLAEQSSVSAEQIRELLGEMKDYTGKAIDATQQGTTAVSDGISAVSEAGTSFREIVERVTNVSSQAQEVSAVVQQLNGGAQLMLTSIQHIAQVSEQAADNTQHIAAATEEQTASMEEVSASAQALAKMAEDLQAAVARFKV